MSSIKNLLLIVAIAAVAFSFNQTTVAQSGDKKAEPLKVGDKAVDFELQSVGKKIKLSDNFGDDGKNVVVVFSRANW